MLRSLGDRTQLKGPNPVPSSGCEDPCTDEQAAARNGCGSDGVYLAARSKVFELGKEAGEMSLQCAGASRLGQEYNDRILQKAPH